MAKIEYPTYGIGNLVAEKSKDDLWVADRFKAYLSNNPHLQVVHGHSYYHLLYFTEGSGEHVIDFTHYPVKKGSVYFMKPGQVHRWFFGDAPDGYVINFSDGFLEQAFVRSQILELFPFWEPMVGPQVVEVPETMQPAVENLFETILTEQVAKKQMSREMMTALLIQLFVTIKRTMPEADAALPVNYNATILRNFQQLIERHFAHIKLPKDYAAMLYITPNHLNALCKDATGISAGELIRKRIILEAKRLLVNLELSINEIGDRLNFQDSSYFIKFFKKDTGITPETFRKQFQHA
ncbi:AraC-type DNA-binding protein [Filimonas lacunae]|uniref:AraC-type DNA-binding protein n=1 Tax=Filimonas lacunae TaxID=477680 RepID=A0A173MBC1_9BACT|nr:AraC family transcriptional regulator [Filimonas lacunae]BAV04781.1 transcriptional regulator, AraC family [Filimonas lacunae]SIT32086.1 AraC-type DNA-binding protein [Filimonas lacunae]